ncbi:MAG TPA: hypothetical protein VHC47_10985 [Mucilaginibacter sp.]|nr:hypothetical protein [Mucilaginibacter sp.]
MKKLSFIFAVVTGLFFGLSAKAQTTTVSDTTTAKTSTAADYFPGKWNVTIFGTPNGDAKMNFILERKDGKLGGAVQDTTGKEISKITSVDEKDKNITVAFSTQGYDVTVTLEPVDNDHVKGSLMGMFDAKGTRVKETTNQ